MRLVWICIIGISLFAGRLAGAADANTPPPIKFNTDTGDIKNKDYRDAIRFKDSSLPQAEQVEAAPSQPVVEAVQEDEGFKTYIGYPKHQAGVIDGYNNLAVKWSYNGQDFNFSNTVLQYGVLYRYVPTPAIQVELNYSRYTASVESGTVSGYSIQNSDAALDQYGVRGQYCWISSANFFRQYCLGGFLGNDAYPVLKFLDSVNLKIDKVQDIVVGVHAGLQIPLSEVVLMQARLAYNYGTGAGNSGELTSKDNNSLSFRLGVPWQFRSSHQIVPHFDYVSRQATLKGRVGVNDDTWATDSSSIGGGVDYLYTF